MGVGRCDQAGEIAHIPLLDLMDALGAPVGDDVASQETCNPATGPDLRDVFANERLHEVIDPIDDQAAARLPLLLCRIPSIATSGKDPLALGHALRQRDASAGPN